MHDCVNQTKNSSSHLFTTLKFSETRAVANSNTAICAVNQGTDKNIVWSPSLLAAEKCRLRLKYSC